MKENIIGKCKHGASIFKTTAGTICFCSECRYGRQEEKDEDEPVDCYEYFKNRRKYGQF